MQFAHGHTIPFRDSGTSHRGGNIEFKYLLKGQEGSPQNYELSVVRTTDRFYGPPHRHNFDQMRLVLKGKFGQPGRLELQTGEVGYYPEGTPYQIDSGDTEVLLLQFGGAAGHGFTHYDELRKSYPVLAQKGEFKDGIFRWHTPPDGTAKQQDGYEALWELINGRPLVYPKARYHNPVLMDPRAFDWSSTRDKGVHVKHLGRFTERDITVGQVRIDAGAQAMLDSPDSIRLLYVVEGSGRIGGQELSAGCAFEILQEQTHPVSATSDMVLLDMLLPRFDAGESVPASRVTSEASA